MKQLKYISIALIAVAVLTGCASKKRIAKSTKTDTTEVVTEPSKDQPATQPATTQPSTSTTTPTAPAKPSTSTTTSKPATPQKKTVAIVEKAIQAQPEFKTLQAQRARFVINYQQRQLAANGAITMIKDSILIVSVQPILGIELLRMEATKKDVTIIDKMNRRYDVLTYAQLAKQVGIAFAFDDVQAIVMDHLFVAGKKQSELPKADAKVVSKDGVSTVTLTEGVLQYTFAIDEKTYALLRIGAQFVGKAEQLDLTYGGHMTNSGILFPTSISLNYKNSKSSSAGTLELPNIVFNSTVNATRLSLSRYSKTDFNTILSGK